MGSAAEGFIQGFAGTLAPTILERKKEARDYFNKQVEYARTTGLQNRQRVRSQTDATLSIARQLEQIGVPKAVIMAQVNQDPAGLAEFYTQAQKINGGASAPLTPDQWTDLYDIGGDFKAPDEDLATFIARTYDPITNATQAPGFQQDPKGSWLASMMGFSAMDEARAELGQTQIAEGLTADQLIQYGDAQPQRIGGTAVVTTDQEALRSLFPEDERSLTESNLIATAVDEALKLSTYDLEPGQDATEVLNSVIQQVQARLPQATREEIQRVAESALLAQRYTLGGSETGIEEPSTTPSGPLTAEEVGLAVDLFGIQSIVNNPDGTATVTYADGTTETGSSAQLREEIEKATR